MFGVALPAILITRYLAFIVLGLYQGDLALRRLARGGCDRRSGSRVSEAVAFGIVGWRRRTSATSPRRSSCSTRCSARSLIGASRFGERALFRARTTLRRAATGRRTLIVGAGRSGRSLVRELRETPGEKVVGFVDDDPRLHRRRLLGVPRATAARATSSGSSRPRSPTPCS